MQFVKLIEEELRMVVKYVEPTNEVEEKDKVVGEANEYIKKIFTSLNFFHDKYAEICQTLKEHPENIKQVNFLIKSIELLRILLWTEINMTYELWDRPNIGIRKGWKIIEYTEEINPIDKFLKKMFGSL